MTKLISEIESIITELTNLQQSGSPIPSGPGEPPIPRMIPMGDGQGIIISSGIAKTIRAVAQCLMDNDPSLKGSYTNDEWNKRVEKSLGEALASIDLKAAPQKNAQSVLDQVKSSLDAQDRQLETREHAFGCTLFGGDTVAPFDIGPVKFESREDWLERKRQDNGVSAVSHRRIKRKWGGEKLKKREPSNDSVFEDAIIEAIGSAPYVASVTVEGLASETGKQKALTAARLALTVLALLAPTPSAALKGFNLAYDGSLYQQKSLVFRPEGFFSSGSQLSRLPNGPWLKPGEWANLYSANKFYFDIAGEVLEYVISPEPQSLKRPSLMNTLAQALLWFHEGCRDPVTLMAIVNFTASMDALSVAGERKGIRQLIEKRLGMKDDTPVNQGGSTMKSVINYIYGEGRSRTIHGTNDKFGHDWSITRSYAEHFASHCLIRCMEWAENNPGIDDPTLMKT